MSAEKSQKTAIKESVRYCMVFAAMLLLLAALVVWNINSGSVPLTVRQVAEILFGVGREETAGVIVWQIRLPRICAAVILGGALAVSGFLLQTFFSNPIAGPFVLGISSGAKLFVALVMIWFLGRGMAIGSWAMVAAAFAGSMLSMGFVLLAARKVNQMSMLVVCGVMISYICSAVTDFVVTFADDSNIVNLHNWSLGSFSGISWEQVQVMSGLVAAAVLLVFAMSKQIGAYQLGENYARSMGVNIRLFRADSAFQSAFRLCNGICGTDFFCGDRSAPSGKRTVSKLQAINSDPRMLPGGRSGMPAMRYDRQDGICSGGVKHQLRDGIIWRSGGDLMVDRRKGGR